VHGDICDAALVGDLVAYESPTPSLHFAANRTSTAAFFSPAPVFETNLRGTFTLLEAAHHHTRDFNVSTDEVYGSIDPPHDADENYPLRASSPTRHPRRVPDLLALVLLRHLQMAVTVTRASNNYGPYQFPKIDPR